MSSQRSQQSNPDKFRNKQLQFSIKEENTETDYLQPLRKNQTSAQKLKEDIEFAERMATLPDMSDLSKNITKTFTDNNRQQFPSAFKRKNSLKTLTQRSKVKTAMNEGGFKYEIEKQSNEPQSQNVGVNTMNRSFSQQQINNSSVATNVIAGLAPGMSAVQGISNSSSQANLPQVSSRIADIAQAHFENLEKIYNYNLSAGNTKTGGFNIALKNSLATIGAQTTTNRLSPLPSKYKQYLPNIIKKKANDPNNSLYFNPREKLVQNRKEIQLQLKTLDQSNTGVRPDVSYLKESNQTKNPTNNNQPTILTTGDKGQDELIEVTLGYKNIGKSLIDLPQNLEELISILKTYDQNQFGSTKQDIEEKLYEQYLYDNFKPMDMIQSDPNQKEFYLPNLQLKQYMHQSKFLNNQSSKTLHASSNLFNIQDKKGLDISTLEKQPPFINTRPEQLSLVHNKLIQKFGMEVFQPSGNQSPPKTRKQQQTNQLQQSTEKLLLQNTNTKSKQKLIEALIQQDPVEQAYTDENKHNESNSHSPVVVQRTSRNQGPLAQINSHNLGYPTSRTDAILLIAWFERMIRSIQQEVDDNSKEDTMFPLLQLVMNICIKELSRQVSVQCIERGLLLQKVFDSYVKLIDLVHKNYKNKRKAIKQQLAEKLDKYISAYEDQVRGYRDSIDEYKINNIILQREIEDHIMKYKRGQNLVNKFKKKCFIAQKDLEAAQKKIKFLETQNNDLKSKYQELADKYGEEISEMDDHDKRKLMLQIEQEMAEEQDGNFSKNEIEQAEQDVEQIPDNDIIKEEEKTTDMVGFEEYQQMIYGKKVAVADTQTEKVTRRHMKLSVNNRKLGIMKDKETFIDPRMFYTGDTKVYRIQKEEEVKPFDEDVLSKIMEDENQNSNDNISDDDFSEDNQQDNDDMIKQNLKKKRSQSYDFKDSIEKFEKEIQLIALDYGTSQLHQILKRRKYFSEIDINYEFQDKEKSDQSLSSIEKKKKRELRKSKTITQKSSQAEFTKQILQRLKSILSSSQLEQVRKIIPEFISSLEMDINNTSKELNMLGQEMSKKERKARHSILVSRKKEKDLKNAIQKADNLEMDNYNLREQLAEQTRLLEDYKVIVEQLLRGLDEELDQQNSNDIRNQLINLNDKITVSQQKLTALQLMNEDDYALNQSSQQILNNRSIDQQDSAIQNNLERSVTNNNIYFDDIEGDNPGQGNQQQNLHAIAKIMSNANSRQTAKRFTTAGSYQKTDSVQKKALTRIKEFQIGKKKTSPTRKVTHPANIILRKILQKDPKKLKDFMPRKMLVRVISQVYQEKGYYDINPMNILQQNILGMSSGTFGSTAINSLAPLIEWVYDSFMQKYGFKNIAERKFIQLISSCISQKDQIPRVRLFARFLEVYDDFSIGDYNRYLEIVEMFTQQILNFKFEDDTESILLPAIEKMKVPVGSEDVRQQKHLKGVREAVDMDTFIEFVIESYTFLQEERETMIKELYLAVDVNILQLISILQINTDGFISIQEFQLLMKVFHLKSNKEIQKLFEDYSLTDLDTSNPFTRYLNLEQFTKLSMDKDYFTPKVQYPFIQSKVIVSLFRARLTAIEMNDDTEMLDLIDNFQNCIKYPFSPKVGWLTYRIVDEIFKRIYLKKKSEYYMPCDLKQIGLKSRPSQHFMNSLPLNFFDTLEH